MAEFEIDIVDRGTLPLGQNEKLSYSEASPLDHSAFGVLYSAPRSGSAIPCAVFIPHHINDEATEAWFGHTMGISQQASAQGQALPVPATALGRHTMFGCLVVVIAAPQISTSQLIHTFQRNGDLAGAERLALRVIHQMLSVQQHLSAQRLTLPLGALELSQFLDANGESYPGWWSFAPYAPASDVLAINGVLNVGQMLYQLLMGYSPRLPLSPFDDTAWQARHLPFVAQGALSVGLRYLLTALFQSPVHERFMTPDGASFLGLQRAIEAWDALMNSLGSVIDQQTSEYLGAFSAALPAPYRFSPESTAAQAIWYDLWLRIHQADTADAGRQVARSDAMLRAKVDMNEEARAQELIQQALAADTTGRAQDMLAEHRAAVQRIAESRDVTLWALWQHLGRWQTLLELNTPREVIRQIGGALHRPCSEDHAQTLDILENTLIELAADEVLREVRLRQAAIAYRQAGETANFALRYQRELENLPYYLRLPSPANQDFSLLPFTLQGQIVGALTDTVSRAADALGAGNSEVALALLEFARALPISVGEQLVFQDKLAALEDTQRFLNETPGAHIAQQFAEGARLLRQPLIQQNSAVRERIETTLLNLGAVALERVKQATDNRDWETVRAAYDAHRVLTERDSRHLLESLQAAHQKETRTLQTSAILNAYEQIQDTYRQLFTTLKQWPLADILNPERDNRDRQQAARAVMNALNHALECL
jgi:hypothetical protein